MVTLPLTDTTEARYAHTAYMMAVTNDWITPYYDIGIPFWGKPPFSFWVEAVSYKIFGMHDFSGRVPSLIFTLLTMGLIFIYLKTFYHKKTALWGVIVYSTFLLVYALSGAVLTDPYLGFSTTLSMISFIMVLRDKKAYWKYLFFIGLAIGMLAKGPLAIVIVGGGIAFWILFDFKKRLRELLRFPWISGTILLLIISIPWYVLAELKTPGFLDYFIVGEHFKRFFDPGWKGDLYGTSHIRAKGTIWLMWIEGAFPWVLIALYFLLKNTSSKIKVLEMFQILKHNSEISYFVMWSIFTMTFFTVAGNVLWTYVLPALSALAILLAIHLEKANYQLNFKNYNFIYIYALLVPIGLLFFNLYLIKYPNKLPTEKYLFEQYSSLSKPNEFLYYIEKRPFSAQYYSNDKAILVITDVPVEKKYSNSINFDMFMKRLESNGNKSFIAIPKNRVMDIKTKLNKPMKKLFENQSFVFFEV
jgi:4-amino-4-deoxy-L-arabinose transferase-like glycosyltransferase